MARNNGKTRSNRSKQPEIRWQAIMRQSGLTRVQLRELHKQLLAMDRDLAGRIDDYAAFSMRFSGDHTGPSDVADQALVEQETALNSNLLAGELTELREVGAAIARMQDGSYGLCEATSEPIGIARLRARPWARFCIGYAREREKTAHRRSDRSHLAES